MYSMVSKRNKITSRVLCLQSTASVLLKDHAVMAYAAPDMDDMYVASALLPVITSDFSSCRRFDHSFELYTTASSGQ